jgi:hypothetical protein
MLRWGMLCALLLPAAVSAQQVVRTIPLVLQLDVNAQGQVTAAKVVKWSPNGLKVGAKSAGLSPKLAQAVTKTAREWRFKAPQVHGQSVPGQTYAFTDMKIVKMHDGAYRLDLVYKRNGPVFMPRQGIPYPRRMRMLGYNAAVVVGAKVRPDGSIVQAHVVKMFTTASDHGRAFAKASLEFVRHARGVPMQINGQAVTTRIRLPIYYQLEGKSNPMKEYGRQVDALLQPKTAEAHLNAPVRPNTAVAMDSPFVREPQG